MTEVRAAADLEAVAATELLANYGLRKPELRDVDAVKAVCKLARAYLALFHADDEQAITFDDLEAAFANTDVFPHVRSGVMGVSVDTVVKIATRGDIRRLRIGLKLQEQPHAS